MIVLMKMMAIITTMKTINKTKMNHYDKMIKKSDNDYNNNTIFSYAT